MKIYKSRGGIQLFFKTPTYTPWWRQHFRRRQLGRGGRCVTIKQQAIPVDVENFGCHISEILMPIFFIDDQSGVCHLHIEANDTVEIVALLSHHVFPTKNTKDAYDLILSINGRQCFADSSMWDMSYQTREKE